MHHCVTSPFLRVTGHDGDGTLGHAMRTHVEDLRSRIGAFIREHGTINFGSVYVVAADVRGDGDGDVGGGGTSEEARVPMA